MSKRPPLLPRDLENSRIEHERSVAAARAQLDEATRNAAWEAGRQLSLDQAIALALEQTQRVGLFVA